MSSKTQSLLALAVSNRTLMRNTRSRLLPIVYGLTGAVLVVVAFASLYGGIPADVLTGDPAATANINPLTGLLSNLGTLLWCSTTAICGFSAVILAHRSRTDAADRTAYWFLLCSTLLTLFLLFDDLFMFHETLAPQYLGLRQNAVYVFIITLTVAHFVAFRRLVLSSPNTALCVALTCLAASLGMDAIAGPWLKLRLGHWEYLLEDGIKFLGIASWFGYYARVSYQLVQRQAGWWASSAR